MTAIIAYLLVLPLVQFAMTVGLFLGGVPLALLLAKAPILFRVRIAGVFGGIAGALCAVAFGYGVFRWLVGPDSFTIGPFLASTLPLTIPIANDIRQAKRSRQASLNMLPHMNEAGAADVKGMATAPWAGVVGQGVGLALAGIWIAMRLC